MTPKPSRADTTVITIREVIEPIKMVSLLYRMARIAEIFKNELVLSTKSKALNTIKIRAPNLIMGLKIAQPHNIKRLKLQVRGPTLCYGRGPPEVRKGGPRLG